MISKKSLSALLTSVSLATLAVAQASRAGAASLTTSTAVVTWATSTDWLNINASNIGTLTNNATIADGFPNFPSRAVSVYVAPDSTISEFVNADTIRATEDATPIVGNNSSTDYATATALLIDGTVPLVTNNGLIHASAFAHDLTPDYAYAQASAYGVRWNPNGNASQSAKLVNNATIEAKASIKVRSYDEGAEGHSNAAGVFQSLTGSGAASGSTAEAVTQNNGSITATSHADVGGYFYADLTSFAGGVVQTIDQAETVSAQATNANNKKIVANASGLAQSVVGFANATYVGAAGIAQNLDADFYDGSWHDGLSAQAVANNNGTIKAVVNAAAQGTYAQARAFGAGAGIYQNVHGGSQLSTAFAKNTGDIAVNVTAQAGVYVSTYAGAQASAVGIQQRVDGNSEYPPPVGSVATATAKNTGNISVSAIGTASGTYVGNIFSSPNGAIAQAWAAGISQNAYAAQKATTLAENSGTINVWATATATVHAGTYAAANAYAVGVTQSAAASTSVAGSVSKAKFTNTGDVGVWSKANTTFDVDGFAYASAAAWGAVQEAVNAQTSKARYENSSDGTINVGADAFARGFWSQARSYAGGIWQRADTNYATDGSASAVAKNYGSLNVWSGAKAHGTWSVEADAGAIGMGQSVFGRSPSGKTINNGTLSVAAQAKANAKWNFLDPSPTIAQAYATYVGGIGQSANLPYDVNSGKASLVAQNGGDILVSGVAHAVASTYANAGANAFGIGQSVYGYSVYAEAQNTSSIYVDAHASAYVRPIDQFNVASAYANAGGVLQQARGEYYDYGLSNYTNGKLAKARFDNSGSLTVNAVAKAGHGSSQTYASAHARASGAWQNVDDAYKLRARFSNSGWINASGKAIARGNEAYATAQSNGYGVDFYAYDTGGVSAKARFRNAADGQIWSQANAQAYGHNWAFADADASGANFIADGGVDTLTLDAVNKGYIGALAKATAVADSATHEAALATAYGVFIANFNGGLVTGTFKNASSGSIYAGAYANAANGFAQAFGILDPSADNTSHIVNKGSIVAYAEGPDAMATGIGIAGTTPVAFKTNTSGKTVVINNGGSIWAGYSTDGGKTVYRGNAINTADVPRPFGSVTLLPPQLVQGAPNPVLIELKNGGDYSDPASIFGNIKITPDDTVMVTNGATRLDGIVNPDKNLDGTLKISGGGKLILGNTNDLEGPSAAYVNTFKTGGNGNLGVELTPDDSSGSYPTITAKTAKLGGKFTAIYEAAFYGNVLHYNNIITANARQGKFSDVVDNSAVLDSQLIYDKNHNVDLKVTRQGFGDVKGLTKNQSSAGNGIEKVYDKLPANGDFTDLVQQLTVMNEQDYPLALDQLAGAEYAQMIQSVLWSTGQLNSSVTDRMDCGLNWVPGAGSSGARGPNACFDPGHFQVWGRVGGGWNNNDGDANAPGYNESQGDFLVGGDYAINQRLFFGIAGGYFSSDMNFDKWGGRGGSSINYDGAQVALYGGWDNGTWYARKIISYGTYSGNSHRNISLGASTIDPSGNFDASVLSGYGEVGRRYTVMNNIMATPYLGLGLAGANLQSFTEKDPNGTGARLKVKGTDANSVATTLGVRVNGHWGGFDPELSLAWQHEFAGTTQTVHASFADAPNGANFNVISSDLGADSLLLGIGGTYSVNPSSDIVVRYNGTFLSGYVSNEVMARWTSKF